MVLDAKALTWAAQNNIDTAKLKAAKIPIYGKWYFPEIPADVASGEPRNRRAPDLFRTHDGRRSDLRA